MKKGIGKTHIGRVRNKNQDAILVVNEKIGALDSLFIVADGMGGHRAGEVASVAAIEAFCGYIKQQSEFTEHAPEEYLKQGTAAANLHVYKLQEERDDLSGMGTTFTAAGFHAGRLLYAHVGDSRIYTINSEGIKAITSDHSFVAEMLRMGKITEDEAKNHPSRNVLTRALGTDTGLEIDAGSIEIPEGTVLLICSDGLYNMVSDEQILSVMQKDITSEEKAGKLVALANENGGRDNISLIIVH